MVRRMTPAVFLSLALLPYLVSAGPPARPRTLTLRASDPERTVPDGRRWRVQGLSPYTSEKGVGTADLYVRGQVLLGPAGAYTVNGTFDLSVNTRQTAPLWILGGSKVSVGDSRGQVVVTETRDPEPE